MPSRFSAAIAALEFGLTVSATATRPAALPSIATYIGVLPSSARRSHSRLQRVDRDAAIAHQLGVAEQHGAAVDPAADAVAGDRGEVLRIGQRRACAPRAPLTIASPSGCSEPRSSEAASRSTVVSSLPGVTTTSVSAGSPRVIVPVLSRMMASSFSAVCSASPERIRMPFSAPLPMPTVSEVGVARPSAHGQAMISVVTRTTVAIDQPRLGPEMVPGDERQDREDHHRRHEVARDRVDHALDRRLRALRVLDHADDAGERGILADLGRRNLKLPVLLSVPPMTSSPTCFSTGIDSPVIIDSSTALAPSVTSPSTGIFSPGRTTTVSPTRTSSTGRSISLPSRTTRAVLACRPISFLIASRGASLGLDLQRKAEDDQRDHDVGHVPEDLGQRHVGKEAGPGDRDDRVEVSAAVMPIAIRVCMLAARCFSASHMPVKNCEPDQSKTGRLSTPSSAQTMRRVSLPIGIQSRRPGIRSG